MPGRIDGRGSCELCMRYAHHAAVVDVYSPRIIVRLMLFKQTYTLMETTWR